jgi:glycosyltransferase involved in cell wall biosynthesis
MTAPTPPRAISVVVPVYNEEGALPELRRRVTEVCEREGYLWELILVDDGSRDRSPEIMRAMGEEDERIRPLFFQRNFGQTAAMAAGIDHARHPVIITLDADLQNDPADFPSLLKLMDDGWDVVSGWRKDRKDKALSRKLPSMLANRLIGEVTGVRIHDYGCTLKAYRANVLKEVRLYGELHRFIPALCSLVGATVTEIPVRHHPRTTGVSKYGISRTFRVILDLLTVKFFLTYATRPMHFFGYWAALMLAGGGVSAAAVTAMKLFADVDMTGNPLLYLTVLLGLAGIQLLAGGILAELLMRTYFESQAKPIYILKKRLGSADTDPK